MDNVDNNSNNNNSSNENISSSGRTIIVVIAFIIISSVVTMIFFANRNKINVSKDIDTTKKIMDTQRVAKVYQIHKDLTMNEYKIKPLLNSLTKAYCPGDNSGKGYVTICSRCNVPLEATNKKDLFRCPICGQEVHVGCPHDPKTHMIALNSRELSFLFDIKGYICPVCGSIEAPLWDNQGRPRCPYCKNVMKIYYNTNNTNNTNNNGVRL
ncbi:MAG: hypothetical protein HQK49_04810 [Oligoflexia bacterium]|nr:hypothetical protein [Oligoflexia bacterium]